MRSDLENKLYNKYPQLFGDHSLPRDQTCMRWGIDCGDGWYNIISTLCELLTSKDTYPDLRFTQIKEKFGGLRIYTNLSNDVIDAYIRFAEDLSTVTCERCGCPGEGIQYNGWLSVLCKECELAQELLLKLTK